MLALHNDPARPMPHKTVSGDHNVLSIGGEEIQLLCPGPNHEVGNIVSYFPAQRTAMLVDVAIPGWVPYRTWGNADYMPGLLPSHDAVLGLTFDTFVGGHVYRTGSRTEVQQSRDFLVYLLRTTQKTMNDILLSDVTAARDEPANFWAAQTVWIDRIARSVTSELIDRWGTRLAAVDTFTAATVGAAVVSLSTDGPLSLTDPSAGNGPVTPVRASEVIPACHARTQLGRPPEPMGGWQPGGTWVPGRAGYRCRGRGP